MGSLEVESLPWGELIYLFEAAILYQREVMVLQLILQMHQLHLVVVVVH
jgi:hypothetical protein